MRVRRAWVPALVILALPVLGWAGSLMGTSVTMSTSGVALGLGDGRAFPDVIAACDLGGLLLSEAPGPADHDPPLFDVSWDVVPSLPDTVTVVTWHASAFRLPSLEPVRLRGIGGAEDGISIMMPREDEAALLLVVVQRNNACGVALLG